MVLNLECGGITSKVEKSRKTGKVKALPQQISDSRLRQWVIASDPLVDKPLVRYPRKNLDQIEHEICKL